MMNAYFARLARRSDIAPGGMAPRAATQAPPANHDAFESHVEVLVPQPDAAAAAPSAPIDAAAPPIRPDTFPAPSASTTAVETLTAPATEPGSSMPDGVMAHERRADPAAERQLPAPAMPPPAVPRDSVPIAEPDAEQTPLPETAALRAAPPTHPSSAASATTIGNPTTATDRQTGQMIPAGPDTAMPSGPAASGPAHSATPPALRRSRDGIAAAPDSGSQAATGTTAHARPMPHTKPVTPAAANTPAQSAPQVHIGRIELEVRQAPPVPAPPSAPQAAPARSTAFNPHRHYLRGV